MRKCWIAALVLALASGWVAARERRSEAERQQERIQELRRKLARRSAMAPLSEEQKFLHARAAALLDRLKAMQDRYVFDRLSRAADDLLEASEEIFESREPAERPRPEDRQEAVRDLQRYYFRVQQAEYFAPLSGETDAALYVKHSRALYQQGRSAFDQGQYRRARKLAEAAALLVSALERLAQSRISGPEPPTLK